MLEELDRPEPHAGFQLASRPGESLPEVAVEALEQQHFGLTPAGSPQAQARWNHSGVVDDDEALGGKKGGQIAKSSMLDRARDTVVDEQPGVVTPFQRPLRDELRRQFVVKLGRLHADIRMED